MATSFTLYKSFKLLLASGSVQLSSDTIKAALVTSAYVPDATHDEWADVSANEATGTGYTAGGATLAGVTVTADGANVKIDAEDTAWAAITTTFRYVVLYISGAVGGKTNPLVGYIVDPASSGVSPAGGTLTIKWSSSGLLVVA